MILLPQYKKLYSFKAYVWFDGHTNKMNGLMVTPAKWIQDNDNLWSVWLWADGQPLGG